MAPKLDALRIIKLTDANYPQWKMQITLSLKAAKLWAYVSGTTARPTVVADQAAWDDKDIEAQALIASTLDEVQTHHVYNCNTSREMYDKLKDIHSDSSEMNKQQTMTTFLTYQVKPEQSLVSAFHEIENLVRSMTDMQMVIDPVTVVTKTVAALPDSKYQAFKKAWDSVPQASQTMPMLLSRFKKEDLEQAQAKALKTPKPESSSKAYQTGQKSSGNNGKKKSIAERKKTSFCNNCGKKGHWAAECRGKKQPSAPGNGATGAGNQQGASNQQGTSRDDSKPGTSKGSKRQGPSAFMFQSTPGDGCVFYADSGASSHMCGRREFFDMYEPFDVPQSLYLADLKSVNVVGSGQVHLLALMGDSWEPVILYDVLHVPGSANLFSLSVMAKNKYIMVTDDKEVTFTHKEFGTGPVAKLVNSLYVMQFQRPHYAHLTKDEKTQLWHQRLAHINFKYIHDTVRKAAVDGITLDDLTTVHGDCEPCHLGKAARLPYPTVKVKRNFKPGEMVHSDLSGRMPTASVGGHLYFVLFKDEATGFRMVNFIKEKSAVPNCVKDYVRFIERQTGNKVKSFKSDNGTEYVNRKLDSFFMRRGIMHETSAPYNPQSNGRIEREMRTIKDGARAMMQQQNVPQRLWAEAVAASVYIHNRVLDKQCPKKTAYEVIFGRKPYLGHLRVFGCTAYAHIPDEKRKVWSAKGKKYMLVGYDSESTNYRLFDSATGGVIIERNVRFVESVDEEDPANEYISSDEDEEVGSEQSQDEDSDSSQGDLGNEEPKIPAAADDKGDKDESESESEEDDAGNDDVHPEVDEEHEDVWGDLENTVLAPIPEDDDVVVIEQRAPPPPPPPMPKAATKGQPKQLEVRVHTKGKEYVTKVPTNRPSTVTMPASIGASKPRGNEGGADQPSTAGPTRAPDRPGLRRFSILHQPDRYKSGDPKANVAMAVILEPTTYAEAMASPYANEWSQAMDEEMRSHAVNGTWTLVKRPQNGRILDCRWIYKVKYNSDGSVQRFKARLVVKGYRQREGIDYDETFATVCRHESIRLLLALATQLQLYMKQFDVKTAFLHGELKETIFMSQPEGYEVGNWVLRLIRSLYGLKQSPRCWSKKFCAFLRKFKLRPLSCDSCVYIGSWNGEIFWLIIYVDDGLLMSRLAEAVDYLLQQIQATFEITVSEPSSFVGFEIHRLPDGGLLLNQHAYIEAALARFNMQDCRPLSVPLQPGTQLLPVDCQREKYPYQQLVGTLIFLSNLTRPDISFAVSKLAQFMNGHDSSHWEAAKKVLRYLQGTKTFGLRYSPVEDVQLSGYTDSDYAGDQIQRKSTGGFAFFLGNSLISWSSQKQPLVALSSTEAEYVALGTAARETVWLRRFLEELGFPQQTPTPIYVDNQSAIKLAKNPEFHKRTKHIQVRYHYTRELVEEGIIELRYIPTADQRADILTKPLLKTKHSEMLRNLQLGPQDNSTSDEPPDEPQHSQRPNRKTGSSGMLLSLALLLLCVTSVSAVTAKIGQPVLWRPSDVPVMTGHYEVHLVIKFLSPCDLLTNETLHADVLPGARKKCYDLYDDLFMGQVLLMCGRRNVTEMEFQGRRKRIIVMALVGIAVGTILVTAAVAGTALGFSIDNKRRLGELEGRLDEAERRLNAAVENVHHLNRTEQLLRKDMAEFAKDLGRLDKDFTEFKQKQADTAFTISYITGRLVIGNQLIKEARRQWVRNRVYAPLLDYFNFTMPCGDQCPLEFARPRRCKMSDDGTILTLTFLAPLVNNTMVVVEADPFNIMHQTKNSTCSIRYVGPESAIVSANGTCIYSLNRQPAKWDMVFSPSMAAGVCRPPNELGTATRYFKLEKCTPKGPTDLWDYMQVKAYHGQYYIYCPGLNISLAGVPMPCPNTTFLLPITSSFNIGEFEIQGNQVEYNHREVPDPLFSLHTNWNLQPNVNLEEIVKELEATDNESWADDTAHDPHAAHTQMWMGIAITLLVVIVIIIAAAVVAVRCMQRKAPESIHLTVTPTGQTEPAGGGTEDAETRV